MTSTARLPGDWRSGAYGGNRRAHLFQYGLGQSRKSAACGARTNDRYRRRATVLADACRDCLVHAASGRTTAWPSR